jgi:hypothetical protein
VRTEDRCCVGGLQSLARVHGSFREACEGSEDRACQMAVRRIRTIRREEETSAGRRVERKDQWRESPFFPAFRYMFQRSMFEAPSVAVLIEVQVIKQGSEALNDQRKDAETLDQWC